MPVIINKAKENKVKRILVILAFVSLLAVNTASALEYFLDGWVYAANGASGTAVTENSFATMHAYRTGINNQIGALNAPGRVFPLAGSGNAAFYVTDVGSSDWLGTAAAEGQTITAVFEVYAPLFGWAGDSYIACTRAVITSDEAINLQTDISPVQLKVIPTPQVDSISASQIVLSIIGMDENFISGYDLFRSTTASGTYSLVGTISQNRGVSVQIADTTALSGQDYYYKWGVNFIWGGGGGAPLYYSSTAKSSASGAAAIPTATETVTASPTATITPVNSATDTPTFTETLTLTLTVTSTPVDTATYTETVSPTAADTASYTPTETASASVTQTRTMTAAQTSTGTPSATVTHTLTPAVTNTPVPPVLYQPVAYPQPASDSISFAYKLNSDSWVKIYIYNLMASQVAVFEVSSAPAGISSAMFDISKFAPGVYFYLVKTGDPAVKFSVQKFLVERE